MILEFLVILLLLVLNGFFAMSELAMMASRRSRLQQMAQDGHRGARTALALSEDPSKFLSTVQVGITLVGILAGAFGGATLSDPLEQWLRTIPGLARIADGLAFAIVVAVITYLSLIVGELVPKRIALTNAERIAAAVARPMVVLSRIGGPVVWLLRRSTDLLLGLLRVRGTSSAPVTQEEIRSIIAESTEAGVFVQAEKEMIDGVLRLADRSVRSIMTPRPEVMWLDPEDRPEDIRREISESGHSRFPVSRGEIDEVIGIVQTKDLLDALLGGGPLDLAAAAREPLVVHDGTPVLKLLDVFRQAPIHMAIVVDEYGSFEGVVTPTDILTAIAGELPETADAEADAVQRQDGSWLVDGKMPIDEVERMLGVRGLRSEDEDYHTMAGFVLWRLGHLPKVAESFAWRGLHFEVVDLDGRRIDKVMVRSEGA